MLLQNSVFSAQQITTLINDLLDLAKLEKGQFTFNNEFFNMRDMILQGIQQVQYMATQKSISIKCRYFDKTGSSLVIDEESVDFLLVDLNVLENVYGDPRRFVQIMQNFLSNAVKFTSKNG
jgi:signal transduction histidine kinase